MQRTLVYWDVRETNRSQTHVRLLMLSNISSSAFTVSVLAAEMTYSFPYEVFVLELFSPLKIINILK